MSIYMIKGPAGCGKSYFLNELILREAEKNEKTSYIFTVPEQSALSTEKELVEKSTGHGIMNIEVLSFTRLAYRIMEEAGDAGYPVLNDMGKSMLIRKVMQEERENLRLYAGKERNAGFLDEIKSVISELSQYLVTPDMLDGYAKNEGDESGHESLLAIKLGDISRVYRGFKRKIEGVYTTAETMFELCYKHISASKLLEKAVLVFDGYTGFTPSQYAFVERLMSKVKDIYFCVTADSDMPEGTEGIFTMSAEMIKEIILLGEKNGFKTYEQEFERFPYLSVEIAFIRDSVFKYPIKRYAGDSAAVITEHQNRKNEACFAAARISELVRKNVKYSEIAVITGDLEGYAPHIEKAFRDCGIAFHIDETKDISDNPLITFISHLLNAADSDFRADEVTELIKSPLSGISPSTAGLFENYLICYGYRGRSRYRQKWTAEKKLHRKADLEEINGVREFVLTQLEKLPANKGKSTVHEIIASLYELFVSFGVKERLLEFARKISESGDRRAESYVREYERVYEAVLNLFQQMEDLMGDEICAYREFLDIFMTGVRKTKLGVLPPNKDVVTVGDVKRTRLKGIRALFFIGVNEGIVPAVSGEGGVLTDEERESLGRAGCKLAPGIKERPLNEEFYIYLALSKPQEKLYVSYALTTDEGEEIKPSYLIGMLTAITGKSIARPEKNVTDLVCFDKGISYVMEKLGKGENAGSDSLYEALIDMYVRSDGPEAEFIKRAEDDLRRRGSYTMLTPETADRLYGHVLKSSISRMEMFAKCAYSHFLRYGLGIEKRPEKEPDALDYGNLFHDALRRFGLFVKKSGGDWSALTPEIYEAEALNCFNEALSSYGEGVYCDELSSDSLAQRMRKVMLSTVRAVVTQIKAGSFEPEMYEYAFSIPGRFMNLTGKIDRIDVCRENGETWLKIVDYKTGDKRLNFEELYNGIQLQLMVYMNVLLNSEEFRDANPAAAFYQEVDDPSIEGEGDIEQKKISELRPTGTMLNESDRIGIFDNGFLDSNGFLASSFKSDAVRLKTTKDGVLSGESGKNRMFSLDALRSLAEYAGDKTYSLSKEAMKGKIEIKPYKKDKKTACDYCDYRSVCGFDRKIKGYVYNNLKLGEEEAISRMVKE